MLLFQSQAVQLGSVTIEAAIAILILAVLFKCTKPELLTVMQAQLFAVELFFNIYLILQYMAPAFVTMFKTVLRRQRVYLVHQGGFSTRHIISRFSRCRISKCLWAAKGKEAEFVEYFPSQTPFTQPNPLVFQAHLPHSTCPFPLAPCCRFCSPHLPYPG